MRASALRLIALLMLPGFADAATFTPLGPGADYPEDASAYGGVVVGKSEQSGAAAFGWTGAAGTVYLADSLSDAPGVSDDGRVVVWGASYVAGVTTYQAYRWIIGGEVDALGDLAGGGFYSFANAVSADGSVVVGASNSAFGTEAFRWTSVGGMVGLGDLPGSLYASVAHAVSADGSVVVGDAEVVGGTEAFRWTSAGGMVGLGQLTGGYGSSAMGASAAGSVVVGAGVSNRSGFSDEAFRWTSAGGMVGLGDLPGGGFYSVANAVSADGSVVVGTSESLARREAFVWTQAAGMRPLMDVLLANGATGLAGWFLEYASGISPDGSVVVGNGINPLGQREGFVANISPADTSPDPIFFVDQTGVATSATIISAAVPITGITAPVSVTIVGGEYSVGCTATFTADPGTITNGQTVCVRQMSAVTNSTMTSTTLAVGSVTDVFRSTTVAASGGGGGGGGGALDCLSLLTLGVFGWLRRKATV